MKKIFYTLLFIFLGMFVFNTTSWAIDLMGIYEQALENDPIYKSAWENYLVATEAYPQARALLLPNLALTGNVTYNHIRVYGSFAFVNQSIFQQNTGFSGPNNFLIAEYTLTLRQPIINFERWANLGVKESQVKQASAVYAFATQDLMIRVATAYFNVLNAEDNLSYTMAQKRAFKTQLDQAEERYKVGLDAITSVYNAKASYDLTVAQEIAKRNDVENNLEQLRRLTGVFYNHIEPLKIKFPYLPPFPENVEHWVTFADAQNLNLKASLFGVDAARKYIKQVFAGHLPELNGVATYDRTKPSNHGIGTPYDQYSATLGVQLNLPIYEGGLVVSKTRQARDNYLKNIADMENRQRQIDVSTRQTYNNVLALISKIEADRQSVLSNQSSVASTEAALSVGTRTMVDLLNAEQALYQAKQILASDQYNYIIQSLTLKQLAGILNVNDLISINQWLSPAPKKMIVPSKAEQKSNDQIKTITTLLGKPELNHFPVQLPTDLQEKPH